MELLQVERSPKVKTHQTHRPYEAEKRFQETVNPHFPTLILNAEGSLQYITPAAMFMLGYKPENHIDACFFTYIHTKNMYQVMRDVADMVCYGKAGATWLLRLKTGKNQWRWCKATVKNYLNRDEEAIFINLFDVENMASTQVVGTH